MATEAAQVETAQKTKNRSDRLKLILGTVTLLGCGFLACGFFVGYSLRESLQGNVTPTPTPTVAQPTPTSATTTATATPTATDAPDEYEGWSTYVLSDCNIRLQVPPDWYPGKRGDLDACGSFRTIPNTGFDSFDSYDGTLLIFSPFLNDDDSSSVLAFPDDTYDRYLENIETDPLKVREDEDLLLGDVREAELINKPTKRALIQRVAIGTAEHIFYSLFGSEYVITYGGLTLEDNGEDVQLILNSIEFIEPLQGD